MKTSHTYLRIGEAAKYLGVSVSTLRRWEREGLIAPLRRPGGWRKYLLSDIDALREQLVS